jgi:hypothetical protein
LHAHRPYRLNKTLPVSAAEETADLLVVGAGAAIWRQRSSRSVTSRRCGSSASTGQHASARDPRQRRSRCIKILVTDRISGAVPRASCGVLRIPGAKTVAFADLGMRLHGGRQALS